eukprot:1192796-Prorocentrum_minimum.AAC.7
MFIHLTVDSGAGAQRQGLQQNVYTYTAVIRACNRGGQWEHAMALHQEIAHPDPLCYAPHDRKSLTPTPPLPPPTGDKGDGHQA